MSLVSGLVKVSIQQNFPCREILSRYRYPGQIQRVVRGRLEPRIIGVQIPSSYHSATQTCCVWSHGYRLLLNAGDLDQLDPYVRRRMAQRLDPSTGADWRDLARRLGLGTLANAFAIQSSPTVQVLAHFEVLDQNFLWMFIKDLVGTELSSSLSQFIWMMFQTVAMVSTYVSIVSSRTSFPGAFISLCLRMQWTDERPWAPRYLEFRI